jgi:DNA modification methylase
MSTLFDAFGITLEEAKARHPMDDYEHLVPDELPWSIYNGDALEVLKTLPDNTYDACYCDPPYGLSDRKRIRQYEDAKRAMPSEVFSLEHTLQTGTGSYVLDFPGTAGDAGLTFNEESFQCLVSLQGDSYRLTISNDAQTGSLDQDFSALQQDLVEAGDIAKMVEVEDLDGDACEVQTLDRKLKLYFDRQEYLKSLKKLPSGGFMGRGWDSDVPSAEVWREVMRVLKPGAPLLAFGGTRVWHRLAVNIEDAGFEIRDTFMWLYGCYSEDTQILTPNGWVDGTEVQEGDLVAAWDHTTDTIRFEAVQKKTLAPYNGPMIHLKNDNTDQLLTPNHRVYADVCKRKQVNGVRKGYWSGWQVQRADELVPFRSTNLPLGSFQDGEGFGDVKYAALLGWMWTEGGFDHGNNGRGVRLYQSSVNQEHVDEIRQLLHDLGIDHSEYSRVRTYKGREYTEYTWYWSGVWAERLRLDLPDKKPSWETLFHMKGEEKEAFLDAAMKGDGSKDTFYQKNSECLVKMQTLCHLTGRQARCNFKKGSVPIHNNPKTQLHSRHRKRNPPVMYDGMVWCVTVPSGAVMVRRKGRIFISGNSGFPKGLDLSKGIAAKELTGKSNPEGIRQAQMGDEYEPSGRGRVNYDSGAGSQMNGTSKPLTGSPQSERWLGYKTAIKPAWEPIVVAQKPLDGTYVNNALEHGVAGYNIDGSRIGTTKRAPGGLSRNKDGGGVSWSGSVDGSLNNETGEEDGHNPNIGRYPTNVVLSHTEECVCKGTKTVKGHKLQYTESEESKGEGGFSEGWTGRPQGVNLGYGDADGNETVEDWECSDECPVKILDEQTGVLHAPGNKGTDNQGGGMWSGSAGGPAAYSGYTDAGGASRFYYCAKASTSEREAGLVPEPGKKRANSHPTAKPLDLNRYFTKLILPPAREDEPRKMLIPFSGVGSEMIGAFKGGWDHVTGIELQEQYVDLAEQRLRWWVFGGGADE